MYRFSYFLICFLFACTASKKVMPPAAETDILHLLLEKNKDKFSKILANPNKYRVQVIYTQIDRDAQNLPHFTSYTYHFDSTSYFYPASTVKMPMSFLALEKLNHLKNPMLNKYTAYRLDSARVLQIPYSKEPLAQNGLPSIAQDVKEIFIVSDNYAYNHLYDFMGQDYINTTLQRKGYNNTRILHRFSVPGIDNRHTAPMTFYKGDFIVHRQTDEVATQEYPTTPMHDLRQGVGYYDNQEKLVNEAFDFSKKNFFALSDIEKVLKSVLFPEVTPAQQRFDLTEDDYQLCYKYMSIFPRESTYPPYKDTSYYDGYCKFLMYADGKQQRPNHIRIFNKVGDAYGFLTDCAYIVDFKNNTEFMLSATIHCNEDGIFNDDKYDYETIGYPFMGNLGRMIYDYEQTRPRKNKPNLSKFKLKYD
jgi:Beta-lactamase enzyme family